MLQYVTSLAHAIIDLVAHPAVAGIGAMLSVWLGWLAFRTTRKVMKSPRDGLATLAAWTDVVRWGWDGERLLKELIELDYLTTPKLDTATEGTPEQWGPVFADHPDTWRLLIEGQRNIVGYWHFVTLSAAEHAKAKNGELLDSEITIDKLHQIELPGTYDIYFTQICIRKSHRGVENTQLLFESFFATLSRLADHDVWVREILANAFSDDGMALCQSLLMEPIARHKIEGTIFAASIDHLLKHRMARRVPGLRDKYARHAKLSMLQPLKTPRVLTGAATALPSD